MTELTDLQSRVLNAFFERRNDFFLTGGGALVGFHLHHRVTHDLDLFTTTGDLDEGEGTLRAIAADLGLHLETLRRSPDSRRFLMKSSSEGVVIDLVRDAAPQLLEKPAIGGILVDSALEILANKLCTLLSRTEIRDLVDVARLEQAGLNPIAAIALARQKDGGMSAAQLAWVLSTFPVPATRETIHGMSSIELEDFRDSLVRRLTAEAYPKS